MASWSSLPADLVHRIADCLLSTNDLDTYMDFRAVCPGWRSATDDPITGSSDPRFRPLHWIIIDEVLQSERARLLVNTATGRVVRKDLPLLRRFYVVATTHGGFLVLADKQPPHAARVLNPFTGHMIVFRASVPSDPRIDISAAALGAAPFPTLALLSDRCYRLYTAAADSKYLIGDDNNKYGYVFTRLLVAAGACADGEQKVVLPPTRGALPKEMFALMKLCDIDPAADYAWHGQRRLNSCFLVKSGTQLLAVAMLQRQLKVFNLSTVGDEAEPLKSIGDRAIFIGYRRCVCVSADKFPSVVANCIYYAKGTKPSLNIYRYDLQAGKEEMVSEAVDSLDPATSSFLNFPLITVVQLLSSYTNNVRESQLPKEKTRRFSNLL